MVNPFTPPDPLEDSWYFVGPIRWCEHGDGVSHCFASPVAEDPLGTLIPTGDDAIDVLADDGVVGRFDNRGQKAIGLFRPPPVGHITKYQNDAPDFPLAVRN